MTNIYFISDTHYSHKNIVGPSISSWSSGYRDFDSMKDMNDCIVDAMNEAGPNDIIYHNGDWSFGGKENIRILRDRIRCKNIVLCLGNHDHHIAKYGNYEYKKLFSEIHTKLERKIGDVFFTLNHYAQRVWNESHHGAYHLYGHSHGTLPDDPNALSLDVGFDTCLYGHKKYTMYHYDEIVEIMKQKIWKPVDHHNERTT